MTQPDNSTRARDHLANERTFLAWVRTGLAVVIFGFAIGRFAIAIREFAEAQGSSAAHWGSVGMVRSGGDRYWHCSGVCWFEPLLAHTRTTRIPEIQNRLAPSSISWPFLP